MKAVLVVAAVLGLSSSAAFAECAGHVKTTASVDTQINTASIVKSERKADASVKYTETESTETKTVE